MEICPEMPDKSIDKTSWRLSVTKRVPPPPPPPRLPPPPPPKLQFDMELNALNQRNDDDIRAARALALAAKTEAQPYNTRRSYAAKQVAFQVSIPPLSPPNWALANSFLGLLHSTRLRGWCPRQRGQDLPLAGHGHPSPARGSPKGPETTTNEG